MVKISFLFILLSLLISCKKAEDRTCWKGRGKETTKEFSMEGIESLKLGRNIRFVLIQDSTNKVVIKTGEKLINFIQLATRNKELEIQNENDCHFLRYGNNEVLVELHFTTIRKIYFEGSEPLINEGQLSLGFLYLIANDNAAEINLNLNVDSLFVNNPHAWPIVQLSGSSKYCQINIEGDAKVNLRNLTVENEFKFASESSQLGEINVQNAFKFIGQLRGNGDVHYYGESVEFYKSEIGYGRFIKQ